VAGDVNGLRLGVPEIVRLGLGPAQMAELAALIAEALDGRPDPAGTKALRGRVSGLHFMHGS
jgi:glycine hydroxymethyltransferase